MLEAPLEIDPKIVANANKGGASSYIQNKLNEVKNIPDIETRAKNMVALRTSLEVLNSRLECNTRYYWSKYQ